MSMAERVMHRFYLSWKGDPSNLPWHREEPADLLIDAVQTLSAGARVFDVGCGAGVFAVWMAS
jgi:2-polyprenyl-3-methyl-5-hydroxy-6-metoxy-1,4-benzoquinol methylase